MRHSQGPPPSNFPGDDRFEAASRRLTPSTGLGAIPESTAFTDGANEDFLFHLYRGSELLQDNRVHEAKEELERALHLQPRDTKGQDLLAVVYFRLGLYGRAIQIYEQLREESAGDPSLLLNLALCYLKTERPELARRDLEQLLAQSPNHSRAWGYLGLACERLGDLAQAERAFTEGGHHPMAARIAARRGGASNGKGASASPEPAGSGRAGDASETLVVAAPAPRADGRLQELDAGELSFALAEIAAPPADPTPKGTLPPGAPETPARGLLDDGDDAHKPDTRDGPPPLASQGVTSHALNRRPTLIAPVGAPPAHEVAKEYLALDRLPSQRPPSIGLDPASISMTPSLRRPVVAVPSPFGPARSHEAIPSVHGTRTLPPPLIAPAHDALVAQVPPEGGAAESIAPSTPLGIGPPHGIGRPGASSRAPNEPRPSDSLHFPDTGGVVLHRSGVALVRTTAQVGFAARLESIRAQHSGLHLQVLERHSKGKPNGEAFGGVTSPMALTTGEGQLVLAPRAGRKLAAFPVGGEMCFVREEVLLGFGGGLSFENGRLGTGEGESVPVVQLRGVGSVVLEAIGEILRLTVLPDRSLSVRREVILGWFGRLVPRALAPSDAPCGQRGLVSFSGEGHVLIASS